MIEGRCISCGRGLSGKGSTSFPCPECTAILKRCSSCREASTTYKCLGCGFVGP